jgi:hypothetical protein
MDLPVEDIRREQHLEKLLNDTSASRTWNDAPRVVETSYYDPVTVRSTTIRRTQIFIIVESLPKKFSPIRFVN